MKAKRAILSILISTSIINFSKATNADTLTLHLHQPGHWIRTGFIGLSFEAPSLTSNNFNLSNKVYVNLLRNLGPGWFRFGGNSVEYTYWKRVPPGTQGRILSTIQPDNLTNVFRFARGIGWKVILGVNLGHYNPEMAADEAHYAVIHGGSVLKGIEIGNEPDLFNRNGLRPRSYNYAAYQKDFVNYVHAIRKRTPGAPIGGPAFAYKLPWFKSFTQNEAANTTLFTFHEYPTGKPQHPTPQVLLSRSVTDRMYNVTSTLIADAAPTHISVRMGEMNSAYDGGMPGTSDVYASALWLADALYTFADQGIVGVNLHGGFGVGGYTPIDDNRGVFTPAPEYYGALLFHIGAIGHTVPVTLNTINNVGAHATITTSGTLRVVIINKDELHSETVSIPLPSTYRAGNAIILDAPSLSSKNGISLAGSSVSKQGTWLPRTSTSVQVRDGVAKVTVRPITAMLITFHIDIHKSH